MPHLSPMNWIFAMLMVWLMLFSIASATWWLQPNSFKSPHQMKSNSSNLSINWKWL